MITMLVMLMLMLMRMLMLMLCFAAVKCIDITADMDAAHTA